MKCPELHITHVSQHHPMEHGGLSSQFMKNIHDGNSIEYDSFFISPPPHGVWTQLT